MADIELAIKIPEDIRVAISRMGLLRIPNEMIRVVDKAIQHGTPLPEGHGELIDRNDLRYERYNSYAYAIANAPTIIEADTESEGEDGKDKER